MFDGIVGVVYEVPEKRIAPPVKALYQFTVPALAVAPRTTVPASHREPGVVPVMVGVVLTVANTDVRDAVVHPLLVAST